MKHVATMMIAAALVASVSGSTNAGWGKFWNNVKHGNNAFKKSWNKSSFGKAINGLGSKNCWEKGATIAFTAGIKGNDTPDGSC